MRKQALNNGVTAALAAVPLPSDLKAQRLKGRSLEGAALSSSPYMKEETNMKVTVIGPGPAGAQIDRPRPGGWPPAIHRGLYRVY